ncbi:uncharacterized protein LOC124286850 [Haliotis rubra]|uniref:uncharacterized protein LOC124286850 n=1 Tax=Haliotis rubra TaxID=36100 RepID=UPI001EE58041|nr:uncharacterized protein LOC124286850 [Haliotis rubra]
MKTQVRCDGNSADSCILTYQAQAYRILTYHETTTPTVSLADLCNAVEITTMCINDKLGTTRVGEGMDTIVSRLWRHLNASVMEVCDGTAPTCPLGVQANVVLSLLVKLTTNPIYTKQAFCSEVPVMLSRVSPAGLESCGTSNTLSMVMQYLQESYSAKCQTTITCEQAATDGNTCLNEITASSSCGDLKQVQACLGKAIGQCSNTSDTLMTTFRSKLANMTATCIRLPVISHSLSTDNTIYLAEGGPSVKLTLGALDFTDALSANGEIRLTIKFDSATPSSVPRCPNDNAIPQVASDTCQIVFDASNNADEQSFEISAVLDNIVDGYQQVEATVTMERLEGNPLSVVADETLGPFNIQVQDRDGKSAICSSINDPHLTTFDGRMYNYMGTGTFLMYENSLSRGNSPIDLQVQTKFQTCGNSGSCNCAVYIVVDNDVIVFDICGNSGVFNPLKVDIKIRGEMSDAVKIMMSADHKTYQVVIATGQIVKVRESNGHLNAWILASASDRGNTRGLCGMFDGDRYNDLTQPDGSMYEITDADMACTAL